MTEVDNYGFVKVISIFVVTAVIIFGVIILLGYMEDDNISSVTIIDNTPISEPSNVYVNEKSLDKVNVVYTPTKEMSNEEFMNSNPSHYGDAFNPKSEYYDEEYAKGNGKTLYTVTIDGVSSVVSLDSNRVTDDVWIINKTVVGSDKDNVILVEYMRSDGTKFEKIIRSGDI